MAEAKFYVYVHRRADTGEVFYIGKGSGRRAWATQYRTDYWRRVRDKYGIVIEILEWFDKEEDAFRNEKVLIAHHRAMGARICNITDGGEGATGNVMPESAKLAISRSKTGRKRPPESVETRRRKSESAKGRRMSQDAIAKTAAFHTGRKRTAETLAKMSAALKGKGVGRVVSEETRAKLSALKKGKPVSEKARAAISAGHEKRTHYARMTPEHKARILAGQAAYWERRRADKATAQN